MTLKQKIENLRKLIAAKLTEREEARKELEALRAAETTDQAAVDALVAKKRNLDAELDVQRDELASFEQELERDEAAQRLSSELVPAPAGGPATGRAYDRVARTGAEPEVYSRATAREGVSFFSDAYRFGHSADPMARERLERHGMQARDTMTERAVSTSGFAGLIVPQYLVDEAALVARAGRPTANIVQSAELPDQGMTFLVPRGTTGASTAVQATENSLVSNTDEVWANVSIPVATISGQQQVSRQSLERGTPGIDGLIYKDLAGAYAVALDSQVISGSGSSGQILGIYNTSGINQATAFGAAATVATFYTKMAGQINAVETTRFLAPTAIVMHPRRWNWLLSQVDSSNRPLVVPKGAGPYNATGVAEAPVDVISAQSVGTLFGLPVITDASVQTSQGSGPEDVVYVLRAQDLILWEDGDGMPRQLQFEQTLGNQLTTTLVVYGYAAFTAGRYPTAVGVVGGNAALGNGLVAPTF